MLTFVFLLATIVAATTTSRFRLCRLAAINPAEAGFMVHKKLSVVLVTASYPTTLACPWLVSQSSQSDSDCECEQIGHFDPYGWIDGRRAADGGGGVGETR